MTATISDGIYFLHPDGSAWIAAHFSRGGKRLDTAYESDYMTHCAAGDDWAGIRPSDNDDEVTGCEAVAIVRRVMGDEVDPSMVAVSRLPD